MTEKNEQTLPEETQPVAHFLQVVAVFSEEDPLFPNGRVMVYSTDGGKTWTARASSENQIIHEDDEWPLLHDAVSFGFDKVPELLREEQIWLWGDSEVEK